MIALDANTEGMNLHVAEISPQIARGARAVLVGDGSHDVIVDACKIV